MDIKLISMRKALGLTAHVVASNLGVSRQAISDLELGKRGGKALKGRYMELIGRYLRSGKAGELLRNRIALLEREIEEVKELGRINGVNLEHTTASGSHVQIHHFARPLQPF